MCDDGWLACESGCRRPNGCGGCDTLAGAPQEACGLCGSGAWACDGIEEVVCVGATELSDNSHCGACDNACTGGTSCEEGACRCPLGDVLCDGVCRADNGCGGCAPLPGVPGGACGACDTGVWVCAPGDPDRLECLAPTEPRVTWASDFSGAAWPTGWTTAWLYNAENPWRLSTARSVSAGQSAHVRGGNTSRSEHHLITAPLVIPAGATDARLDFQSWLDAEGISFCFDGAGIDISTNDGASWSGLPGTRVTPTWDRRLSSGYGNPRQGDNTWCNDHNWRAVRVDLSPWVGQTLRLRFWYATDNTLAQEGWYIDDVSFSYGCLE